MAATTSQAARLSRKVHASTRGQVEAQRTLCVLQEHESAKVLANIYDACLRAARHSHLGTSSLQVSVEHAHTLKLCCRR